MLIGCLLTCLVGCSTSSLKSSDSGSPAWPAQNAGLRNLPLLGPERTRSISAENLTGAKGQGGMAIPNPRELKPAASARAADDLGQGWKVKPFLRVNAGQTVTLMDTDGPGVIQHIWMVEGLSRAHVLRFYWDVEATPSVEAPVPDFFAVGHETFARVNSQLVVVNPANALNCYWPMPFKRHARVTFSNEAAKVPSLISFFGCATYLGAIMYASSWLGHVRSAHRTEVCSGGLEPALSPSALRAPGGWLRICVAQ
jgi:hypothetical protein